ncbi:MAG: CPBP family intramembrane metalloprotease [Chlamydiae bacterium]|nr:CPBP family intramembrane metalloprotease [Chlamydiota bacterium]
MKISSIILSLFISSLIYADTVPSLENLEPVQKISDEVSFDEPYKSPFVSVALSTIFPGLGHLYLGDPGTAGIYAGTVGLTFRAASSDFSENLAANSMVLLQNTWLYGIYSSYRDARNYNTARLYRYTMPNESLALLSYAPLNWQIMRKPEVWGGVLGGLAIAATSQILAHEYLSHAKIGSFACNQAGEEQIEEGKIAHLHPIVALPIGVGEEAFFRGYLQSALTEEFGPVGGIVGSALLFGAAHIQNAQAFPKEERFIYYSFGLPVITGLGAYFSWLTHKNHSLQESVAVHTWYDFTLFALGALSASKTAACTGKPQVVALQIPF